MNRRFVAKLLLYVMAYSVGGLIVCRLINAVFFRNGVSLDQTIIGLWIIRFLAIIFGATVISFIPFIFLSRPHVKKVQKLWAEGKIDPEQMHPFWKHLFYSNYGNVPEVDLSAFCNNSCNTCWNFCVIFNRVYRFGCNLVVFAVFAFCIFD
jgi:hypothetical protein